MTQKVNREQNFNLRYIGFVLLAFFLLGISSCKEPLKQIDVIIQEIESLDKQSFYCKKISFRSRDYNDDRLLLSEYYNGEKGFVIMKINEKCSVFESSLDHWKDTVDLDVNYIGKSMCQIGLGAIAVDSCSNIYFSVSSTNKYEYVIVKDEACLNKKYKYQKFKGQCFSIR